MRFYFGVIQLPAFDARYFDAWGWSQVLRYRLSLRVVSVRGVHAGLTSLREREKRYGTIDVVCRSEERYSYTAGRTDRREPLTAVQP